MKPSEVPDDLAKAAIDEAKDACVDTGSWELRRLLAAVLPAHERQVRERVAAEIEARRCEDVAQDVCAKCSCRREDARIARGES